MMMKLTAAVSCVLLSTSGGSVAKLDCNKAAEFSGRWGLKRSTGGERGTQERATGNSYGKYRKTTTKFAGWWRGLKRYPTSSTKRATGDSGRPTASGEDWYH